MDIDADNLVKMSLCMSVTLVTNFKKMALCVFCVRCIGIGKCVKYFWFR